MGTLKPDNGNEQERNNDSYILSYENIKILVERKTDFIAGKTTSRSWDEIKKQYESSKANTSN